MRDHYKKKKVWSCRQSRFSLPQVPSKNLSFAKKVLPGVKALWNQYFLNPPNVHLKFSILFISSSVNSFHLLHLGRSSHGVMVKLLDSNLEVNEFKILLDYNIYFKKGMNILILQASGGIIYKSNRADLHPFGELSWIN